MDEAIPDDHPLAELLEEIQNNRKLWPRTGITFWKVVLVGLLVLLLGALAGVLYRGLAGPVSDPPNLPAPVQKAKEGVRPP